MISKIDYLSPNFDNVQINPQFIILHYTATDLITTLSIFSNAQKKASAHYIIDFDGQIYSLPQKNNIPVKAWHCGHSSIIIADKLWQNLNDFAIGIELVNLNGNLLEYSTKQYTSLCLLIKHLQHKHVILLNPDRLLGHEHIAGFRGKIDPGIMFNWSIIWSAVYQLDVNNIQYRQSLAGLYLANEINMLKNQNLNPISSMELNSYLEYTCAQKQNINNQ